MGLGVGVVVVVVVREGEGGREEVCSSLLTSSHPDEYDEHNMWNPLL